jgi:hypothetical protein
MVGISRARGVKMRPARLRAIRKHFPAMGVIPVHWDRVPDKQKLDLSDGAARRGHAPMPLPSAISSGYRHRTITIDPHITIIPHTYFSTTIGRFFRFHLTKPLSML